MARRRILKNTHHNLYTKEIFMKAKQFKIQIGDDIVIDVKKPNSHQIDAYFQKAGRSIYQANYNLLLDIAVDNEAITKMISEDESLPMSAATALSDLMGIQESFLLK